VEGANTPASREEEATVLGHLARRNAGGEGQREGKPARGWRRRLSLSRREERRGGETEGIFLWERARRREERRGGETEGIFFTGHHMPTKLDRSSNEI